MAGGELVGQKREVPVCGGGGQPCLRRPSGLSNVGGFDSKCRLPNASVIPVTHLLGSWALTNKEIGLGRSLGDGTGRPL